MLGHANLLDAAERWSIVGEEGRPTSGSADLSRATPAGGTDRDAGRLGVNPERATGMERANPADAWKIMAADLISYRDQTSWYGGPGLGPHRM